MFSFPVKSVIMIIDTDSVTEALTSRYDVDNESARRDAQKFIDSLDREGIIE